MRRAGALPDVILGVLGREPAGLLSDEVVARVKALRPGVHVPSVRSVLSSLGTARDGLVAKEAAEPGRRQRTGVRTRYRLKGGAA